MSNFSYENEDGELEFVAVYSPVTPWKAIQEEGAKLHLQNGQGEFIEYTFHSGRYVLSDET